MVSVKNRIWLFLGLGLVGYGLYNLNKPSDKTDKEKVKKSEPKQVAINCVMPPCNQDLGLKLS